MFGISRLDSLLRNLEGKNILMLGPPGQEKLLLGLKYIHEGLENGKNAAIVTTDLSPIEIETKAQEMSWNFKESVNKRLKYVDCYSWALAGGKVEGRKDIIVSGPSALNDLSIGITQAVQEFYKPNVKIKILFNSLSTLLLYNQPEIVYRFTQITGARLKAINATSLFLMDEGMHEEKTITTVKHLMDFVFEIKAEEDKLKLMFTASGNIVKLELRISPVGINVV